MFILSKPETKYNIHIVKILCAPNSKYQIDHQTQEDASREQSYSSLLNVRGGDATQTLSIHLHMHRAFGRTHQTWWMALN